MSEVTITAAELRKGDVIRLGGYPLTVAHDVHSPERTYIYLDHPGGSEDVLTAFPLSARLVVEREADPDAELVEAMAQAIYRRSGTGATGVVRSAVDNWPPPSVAAAEDYREAARAALAAYRTHEA